MPDDFSADVKQFIEQNIESVAQLEALFLMRQDPDRDWDASAIAKALYIPEDMATAFLTEFSRRGFIKANEPNYSYQPADPQFSRLIDEVAGAYQDRRVAVISLIYSKPLNKVQTFADAFRFGKENPK